MQDQAMDRCHRLGQEREGMFARLLCCLLFKKAHLPYFLVRVYQFAMKDSIEERMYRLQESKTALGNGSLRKLSADERKKARITALRGKSNAPDYIALVLLISFPPHRLPQIYLKSRKKTSNGKDTSKTRSKTTARIWKTSLYRTMISPKLDL